MNNKIEQPVEIEDQFQRIEEILDGIDEDDYLECLERWEEYLQDKLKLPFEAVIFEPQEKGILKYGDKLIVKKLDSIDDLYGIIGEVSFKGKKYHFPICDLQAIDKKSTNYVPLDDYCIWFANR
jgi:hypothetical protein